MDKNGLMTMVIEVFDIKNNSYWKDKTLFLNGLSSVLIFHVETLIFFVYAIVFLFNLCETAFKGTVMQII